jgi:hypothetical protein
MKKMMLCAALVALLCACSAQAAPAVKATPKSVASKIDYAALDKAGLAERKKANGKLPHCADYCGECDICCGFAPMPKKVRAPRVRLAPYSRNSGDCR